MHLLGRELLKCFASLVHRKLILYCQSRPLFRRGQQHRKANRIWLVFLLKNDWKSYKRITSLKISLHFCAFDNLPSIIRKQDWAEDLNSPTDCFSSCCVVLSETRSWYCCFWLWRLNKKEKKNYVKILKIRTPSVTAVISLKFECALTIQ